MPVNWGSIAGQFASLGLTNLAKDALQHGADAERSRADELRRMAELEQKRAELAKASRQSALDRENDASLKQAQAAYQEGLRRYNAFIDAGAELRGISLQATFQSSGWAMPPGIGAPTAMSATRVDQTTIMRLGTLRDLFLDCAGHDPLSSYPWPKPPLEQVAEASRLAAFIYNAILDDPVSAAKQYTIAAADFTRAGMTDEAAKAGADAAACADPASGDLEAEVAAARAAVKKAKAGTLDAAAARIELGETLARAGDTFGARMELKKAERSLTKAGYPAPPPAENLLGEMLSSVLGGSQDTAALMARAGTTLKVRLLFRRLYQALSASPDPLNAREAEQYGKLIDKHQLLTPTGPLLTPKA